MTLDELAEQMIASSKLVEMTIERTLVEAGQIVKKTAQDMIGQEHTFWPPLSEETVEDKERRGFPFGPLLRTGEMRDSIEAEVVGLTLAVGSDDKTALFQEMGTSRIPPRPFLSTALVENLPLIEEKLQADAAKLLTGSRE